MNNEITIKVMQWLESAAQQVGEFASKEIPPFVHEFLQWKFYEAAFDALTDAIMIGFTCALSRFLWNNTMRWAKEMKDESGGLSFTILAIPLLVFIVPITLTFPDREIKDMIQIKIAPKVYLVEKAAEILKAKP